MAANIEGQRNCHSDHTGNAFQAVVDVIAGVAIGTTLVEAGIADNRQRVVAFVFGIFVEYHLHLLSPFDDEMLSSFSATVSDIAVFEV